MFSKNQRKIFNFFPKKNLKSEISNFIHFERTLENKKWWKKTRYGKKLLSLMQLDRGVYHYFLKSQNQNNFIEDHFQKKWLSLFKKKLGDVPFPIKRFSKLIEKLNPSRVKHKKTHKEEELQIDWKEDCNLQKDEHWIQSEIKSIQIQGKNIS